MKTNKRLLALNLCILLLLSLTIVPSVATSSSVYSITVNGTTFTSAEDASGNGWSYSASDGVLTLNGYSGSTIKASGDLVIYAGGGVNISGAQSTGSSADNCGIVVNGSLALYSEGITTITAADGGEAIVAPNILLNTEYGSDFTLTGGAGASAIKANNLTLETKQMVATGGSGASAIYFATALTVSENTSAVITSGSSDKYAITYLSGATHSIDDDVEMTFYDNSSRIVMNSKTGFIYGDIYIDGLVDIRDAVILAQHLAGWSVNLNEKSMAAADVFFDSDINTKDAVRLAQHLAGWDVSLGIAIGDGEFDPFT